MRLGTTRRKPAGITRARRGCDPRARLIAERQQPARTHRLADADSAFDSPTLELSNATLASSGARVDQKKIFTEFGTPRVLISDEGCHFDYKLVATALNRYGVKHKIATAYHPQINGQDGAFNREIKQILEKAINPTSKD